MKKVEIIDIAEEEAVIIDKKEKELNSILEDIKKSNISFDSFMAEDASNEKIVAILSTYDLEDDAEQLENYFGACYILIREYEGGFYRNLKG